MKKYRHLNLISHNNWLKKHKLPHFPDKFYIGKQLACIKCGLNLTHIWDMKERGIDITVGFCEKKGGSKFIYENGI